jgi:hypothetical protein
MNLHYPIFIIEKDDGSIRMLLNESKEELDWYEQIDIENNLYSGWDIKGYPLRVYWDKSEGVKVEITKEIPDIDNLKSDILNYAKLFLPECPFSYSGQQDNIIELFDAVKQHLYKGDGSLRHKIKRFFSRF